MCLVSGLHLNWKGSGLTVWTRGDFSDADVDRQTVQGGQRRFVCSCQTGPKGQEGVSEFNLITWEGPAEPVEPYMQPTEFETKENVNSGNTVESPPNIPAAAPKKIFLIALYCSISSPFCSSHLPVTQRGLVQQTSFDPDGVTLP